MDASWACIDGDSGAESVLLEGFDIRVERSADFVRVLVDGLLLDGGDGMPTASTRTASTGVGAVSWTCALFWSDMGIASTDADR